MKNKLHIILLLAFTLEMNSCKKFLEEKPDKKLAVITSLEDAQAILDSYNTINSAFPSALEVGSDDYFVDANNLNLNTNQSFESDTYLWKKNDISSSQWQAAFKVIENANIVLSELGNLGVQSGRELEFNAIKGNAHFLRGYYFFILAQLYGQPFNPTSADKDLGIPIRLTSVVTEKSIRKSVKESYEQIISDLKLAATLLPPNDLVKTRGCKPAAFGAIAKTYLAIQEYDSAAKYSGLSLNIYDDLLDYNEIDSTSLSPFAIFNKEVTFHLISDIPTLIQPWVAKMDTTLMILYSEGDLRKPILFQKNGENAFSFKGGYGGYFFGLTRVFGGIATDEIYLIKAESNARIGNLNQALIDLNILLKNRIASAKFTPFQSENKNEIIDRILDERRKELVFRGVRWTDLRRYKLDSDRAVTPKRKINNEVIELLPNSPRYTLAIPAIAINLSGMPQNP